MDLPSRNDTAILEEIDPLQVMAIRAMFVKHAGNAIIWVIQGDFSDCFEVTH
jgi:hypothetical protein